MPDSIGRITVPEVAPSGTFPLVTDYPHRRADNRPASIHRFASANGKIEQRFVHGPGRVRHWFQRDMIDPADIEALREFWEARSGPHEPFTYNAPATAHGDAASAVTCCFADDVLSLEHVATRATAGFWLEQLGGSAPSYAVSSTLDRFPDTGFAAALLAQEHEIIPLLRIRVAEAAVNDVTVSDRRCTVGGVLYQERLLTFRGVAQHAGEATDEAVFELGNADGVMRAFAQDTQLARARVELKLYHVGSQTMVNLWAGYVLHERGWEGETEDVFRLICSDPISALNLMYPRRTVSRRCWNTFDDGDKCPYTAQGSLNGSFPSASASSCDHGFATDNGCLAHNMSGYFGGVEASPARARIKLANTGWGGGLGRRSTTVASIQDTSVFQGAAIPEVWTDQPIPVASLIVSGRDEDEFFRALGIVSEGPIGAFGTGHRLDGQAHHGSPGPLGLRTSLGARPNSDVFGITPSTPTPVERAAGLAFIELARTDAKGIQLSQVAEHTLESVVSQGITGWRWSSGTRSALAGAANPIWVAVTMFLRVLWRENASAAAQAELVDVTAAETHAAYCDATVDKLVGSGTTAQFKFRGIIAEQRPLSEWLAEVLACCLGGYTFRFGKLRPFTRVDSVSVQSFTEGNILFDGVRLAAPDTGATRFTATFGERLVDAGGIPVLTGQNVVAADEDAALERGGGVQPVWLEASRSFVGVDSRDQAARLATTRLRELLGGVTAAERAKHRRIQLETTVLALACEPGQVIRITHPMVPGGDCEARIESWELRPDMGVTITAVTSTDSMYDLTVGSTAVDVEPSPVPAESSPQLAPGAVTNFAASEDPFIDPKTGQTMSQVSVTYDEPTPTGSFAGVMIWGAHYDGTDAGTPGSATTEPILLARIPVNASPEARLLPPTPTTGKVLRLWAVSYSATLDPPLAPSTDPTDYVLLDGKQSPPTAPANEWCQQVAGGLDLSAERNPEPDIDRYQVAFTGDKVPWSLDAADAAILDSQVIGEVAARDVSGERWHYLYQEPVLWGVIDATRTHLDLEGTTPKQWVADQWLVETSDGGFSGVNVQILGETEGQVSNATVVSNTTARLTFGTGALPFVGRARFRFRGANGEMKFFCRAMDKSGNKSDWAAFPDCSPFARDGTRDIAAPTLVSPAPSSFLCFFTAGRTGLTAIDAQFAVGNSAGYVGVALTAASVDEAETDANVALKQSINGIHTVEVELTYSADGSTGLATRTWRFDWNGSAPVHGSTLVSPHPSIAGKWITRSNHVIDLPGVAVASGRARVANAWGWGPWATLYAELVRAGGGPVHTGDRAARVAALANASTSGTIAVRPDTGKVHVIGPMTGAVTISAPSPAPETDEVIEYHLIQPTSGAEGHGVTFAAAFKDVPADLPRIPGTKLVLRFRAESPTVLRCIAYQPLPYQA